MKRVFDEFGPIAEKSGAALDDRDGLRLRARGHDRLAHRRREWARSRRSRSTTRWPVLGLRAERRGRRWGRSRARTSSGSQGEYVPGDRSISRGKFDFGGEIGVQRMTRYPAGEHITVPRHVEARTVRTALTASTTSPVAIGAPVLMTGFSLALKTPAKPRLSSGGQPASRRPGRGSAPCGAVHHRLRRASGLPAPARRDPRRGRLWHDRALDRRGGAPLRGARLREVRGARSVRGVRPRRLPARALGVRGRARNTCHMSTTRKGRGDRRRVLRDRVVPGPERSRASSSTASRSALRSAATGAT